MIGVFELLFIIFILCCFCGGGLLLLAILYLILAGIFRWWPFQERRFPADEFFVRNQVILAGPRAEVEAAVAEVRGANLSLLEPALEFDQLGQPVIDCPDVPDDFVVALYEVRGLFWNVQRAVRALNDSAAGRGGLLQAEPNYLSGHPWDPEGSPWDPEGSPWDPEGSPLPNTTPPRRKPNTTDARPEWFPEQWAFERIDLAGRPQQYSGQDVLVGVFDTSPFVIPDGTFQHSQSIDWVNQPAAMSLLVSHPFFAATLKRSRRSTADMRNHGLFVAGLVHALAPSCRIELIRVLENDNRGDLYTLLREIYKFLKAATSDTAGWRGVVLNLSLGIRVPPNEADYNFPPEVRSLIYLMRAARCLQVVVVAAAGNESYDGQLRFANLPARLEQVIGVEACSRDGGRACYANRGGIAAPGGDGGGGGNRCAPLAQTCSGPDCPFGVIGPALEDSPHSGFVYWVGSSFATPMVSGLAALVLEAGQGYYTAEQVAEIIHCGAVPVPDGSQGADVINVRRTLIECLRQVKTERPQQSEKPQPAKPAVEETGQEDMSAGGVESTG